MAISGGGNICHTRFKGRGEGGRVAEVAPGLLLWGLGRTKGKRGSGDEEGKWDQIQGKSDANKSLNSDNETCFKTFCQNQKQ